MEVSPRSGVAFAHAAGVWREGQLGIETKKLTKSFPPIPLLFVLCKIWDRIVLTEGKVKFRKVETN